jgi:hypothetical protein
VGYEQNGFSFFHNTLYLLVHLLPLLSESRL